MNGKMITKFTDSNFFLALNYPCKIDYEDIVFPSAEHAFQASKTLDKDTREKIKNIKDWRSLKTFMKSLELRPGWTEMKEDIMLEILRIKFSNNSLRILLLSTVDKYLSNENIHHDNYWGHCLCEDCKYILKLNKLGIILMGLRNEIRFELNKQQIKEGTER